MKKISKEDFHFFILNTKRLISLYLIVPAFISFLKIISTATNKKKIIVALVEHLGDMVASEPINRFIKKENENSFLIRIVKPAFAEVLEHNPYIDKIVTISCLSEWIYLKKLLGLFYKVIDLHIDKKDCTKFGLVLSNPNSSGVTKANYYKHGSLLEVLSLSANLPKLNERPIYHLPSQQLAIPLPQRYVVVHTTSNDKNRNWDYCKWEQLINYVIEEAKTPVIEVGLKSKLEIGDHNFYNLCGKCSLTEIAHIIGKSLLFIGIDSAFAHFAHALGTPKIILLGYYANFSLYNPYSGKGKYTDIVINYPAIAAEIPVELVIEKFNFITAEMTEI